VLFTGKTVTSVEPARSIYIHKIHHHHHHRLPPPSCQRRPRLPTTLSTIFVHIPPSTTVKPPSTSLSNDHFVSSSSSSLVDQPSRGNVACSRLRHYQCSLYSPSSLPADEQRAIDHCVHIISHRSEANRICFSPFSWSCSILRQPCDRASRDTNRDRQQDLWPIAFVCEESSLNRPQHWWLWTTARCRWPSPPPPQKPTSKPHAEKKGKATKRSLFFQASHGRQPFTLDALGGRSSRFAISLGSSSTR
jgi:hypothetical protein